MDTNTNGVMSNARNQGLITLAFFRHLGARLEKYRGWLSELVVQAVLDLKTIRLRAAHRTGR